MRRALLSTCSHSCEHALGILATVVFVCIFAGTWLCCLFYRRIRGGVTGCGHRLKPCRACYHVTHNHCPAPTAADTVLCGAGAALHMNKVCYCFLYTTVVTVTPSAAMPHSQVMATPAG